MRPVRPPEPDPLAAVRGLAEFHESVDIAPGGRYLHWDKLQYLTPPGGMDQRSWWHAVRFKRASVAVALPLRTTSATATTYTPTDLAARLLLRIDQEAAGNLGVRDEILTPGTTRQRFLFTSITEEAIRSSQLEGAQTERRVAKEMIAAGRAPATPGERMILNNFNALQFSREQMTGELTLDLLLELHRILTRGTLDDAADEGRVQRPGEERVRVTDRMTGETAHVPPPAAELPARLTAMIRFANGIDAEPFLHPVVRACLLHLWLGHDHPFVDGNGRTARTLFYWSMRRQGYWLADFLSISARFHAAPGKYARAFLETETDDGDATYFVLYHLDAIVRAIDELHAYVERKTSEISEVEHRVRGEGRYNGRQLSLLAHALRDPDALYTFASHARVHQLTKPGARNDLLRLEADGLLVRRVRGREHVFRPAPGLASTLRARRD